jgi:deoxyribodipyrimidine photo-lyase
MLGGEGSIHRPVVGEHIDVAATDRPAIWWVRRDFRLHDNPALRAAVDEGGPVLPLFVLDPVLLRSPGQGRGPWMRASLAALDADLRRGGGPGLTVVHGRPATEVPRVARKVGAEHVHIGADFAPYGRRRDDMVQRALRDAGLELIRTGSPYAVAPGTLTNDHGQPFQVFSPFHRTWLGHGTHGPAPAVLVDEVAWIGIDDRLPLDAAEARLVGLAGENPALRAWQEWRERAEAGVSDYKRLHNLPAIDATSHMSIALRWGHLHPRTLLADLAPLRSQGAQAYARQLAWRDFYGDVLFHRPDAATKAVRPAFEAMTTDDPSRNPAAKRRLQAWQEGTTGYPLVDAGMRQMLAEGWMHNRVRMVVASFLIKDLHIGWQEGAAFFMERLHDGELAQNHLNWQWVAGSGTDPAPYFRIFNPITQSEKFDPDGTYIRRYVPELSDIPLDYLHEPWKNPAGPPAGYPGPIVDHAAERRESLDRYAAIKGR